MTKITAREVTAKETYRWRTIAGQASGGRETVSNPPLGGNKLSTAWVTSSVHLS